MPNDSTDNKEENIILSSETGEISPIKPPTWLQQEGLRLAYHLLYVIGGVVALILFYGIV